MTATKEIEILILGAGWTSQFLIPLLNEKNISFAATTRDGRDGTIKFAFDPESDDDAPYEDLPDATTALITFPIYDQGGSSRLLKLYRQTHPNVSTYFIQLGSTGIWDGAPTAQRGSRTSTSSDVWMDRRSPYNTENKRAIAEDELLADSEVATTVLNLCGLWGGTRDPRNFLKRVAASKEALSQKNSIHMIHGTDVARSIFAIHSQFDVAKGKRWLLTDLRVYDWWDLVSAWSPDDERTQWVNELMRETGLRALPRTPEMLGRALDSREFWETFSLAPARSRLEMPPRLEAEITG